MRETLKIISLLLTCLVAYPFSSAALSASPEKQNGSIYLSIVSTETETLGFIEKYAKLVKQFNDIKIISSNDCSNLKQGLVLIASATSASKAEINSALSRAKALVPDSYQRECKIKPGSLLYYNQLFIQPSILNLPADTINWAFGDAKSEIRTLDKDYTLLLKRAYKGDTDDEVEGRQTSLHLFNVKSHKEKTILKQCWDFENQKRLDNMMTFQCMTGKAGNQFIHTVYVYDIEKDKVLLEKQYCQNPSISSKKTISCDEESVNEFGELKLKKNEYRIKD